MAVPDEPASQIRTSSGFVTQVRCFGAQKKTTPAGGCGGRLLVQLHCWGDPGAELVPARSINWCALPVKARTSSRDTDHSSGRSRCASGEDVTNCPFLQGGRSDFDRQRRTRTRSKYATCPMFVAPENP